MASRVAFGVPGGGADPLSHVVNVVTSISERRRQNIDGIASEYTSSQRWLADALSSSKRRILESVGLTAEEEEPSGDGKRRRVGSIEPAAAAVGKENGNPNTVAEAEATKNAAKPTAKGKAKPSDRSDDDAYDDPGIDVYALKVAQLRAELRSRGMDATGLKKDLQARLAARIEEERREATAGAADAADEEEEEGSGGAVAEETQQEEEEEEVQVETPGAEKMEEDTGRNAEADDASMDITSPVRAVEGAMDFPGVDVKALSAKKASPKEEEPSEEAAAGGTAVDDSDAMDVESTAPVVTGDERDDEVMDEADRIERPSHSEVVSSSSDSSQPKRVSSTASYLTCSSGNQEEVAGEDSEEEEMQTEPEPEPEPEVMQSSTKSPKKKNIGHKLLKATSKIFSPNSKKAQAKSQQTDADRAQISEEADTAQDTSSTTKQAANSAVAANPPSARKVKAATDFFSKLASEPGQQAPKLGSALKTPAIRGDLTSGSTSGGSKSSTTSSVSASSSSSRSAADPRIRALKENAALRKARLAELRAKSKPVHVSKPSDEAKVATTDISALRTAMSSAKAGGGLTSTAEKQKEEKRKLLAAQMREKHAAEAAKKQQQAGTLPPAQPSRPAVPTTTHHTQKQPQQTQRQQQQQQQHHQPAAPVPPKPAPPKPKPMSPMDTYEISDREESDSDSSDYDSDDNAPKKKIPNWAQKANLIPALERQFVDGPGRLDPDEIFPEVSTCNLELVFDKKKARYQKRTSSGNWTKDRVTAAEKLIYKRTMGFKN